MLIHNLGFPRIGARRELKFALERFWRGDGAAAELLERARDLRLRHLRTQACLDHVPVADFSLYDHVLDMSVTVGNVPARAALPGGTALDTLFRAARGRAPGDAPTDAVAASEMTKWFDTNYHYLVPEFSAGTEFRLDATRVLAALAEGKRVHAQPRPVLLGPVTYLWLGKSKDGSERLKLLPRLLTIYTELLERLDRAGADWVQLDEPVLATECGEQWQAALRQSHEVLAAAPCNKLLATYFGPLRENLELVAALPVQGLHIDALCARHEVAALLKLCPPHRNLSLGVVDGRNVWRSDLTALLDWLEPIRDALGPRLWLGPTCSLLHVPMDVRGEEALDPEVRSWLAFAEQKLGELVVLKQALQHGRAAVSEALAENAFCVHSRRRSARVVDPLVRARLQSVSELASTRSAHSVRSKLQADRFRLPEFPTTTIGSFPQTEDLRRERSRFKQGKLEQAAYEAALRERIAEAVARQEALGLDVLVHGEPERNDMVEYFGQQLRGYAFTDQGWVQSYGSRCVKPPILFGDVSRPQPMTVRFATYAQSLTTRPMKGMLTGPVTILNWSFVRDDQPRQLTCRQLALAMRDEVLDLEAAGIGIIQIDEAALREGLPLRRSDWAEYLGWAVECFRLTAGGVRDETQIHTHMCYSEFNDIIEAIAAMDADVITIETSRSDMELLEAFRGFRYPNQIGPGVYDIHSPNVPSVSEVVDRLRLAAKRIPRDRLWVNPDCGLKTRQWQEVWPALENMVAAARLLRSEANGNSSE